MSRKYDPVVFARIQPALRAGLGDSGGLSRDLSNTEKSVSNTLERMGALVKTIQLPALGIWIASDVDAQKA
jgi:hypothetical protein